jgi:7SK snRNA methylphosphate capping enzyme
MYLAKKYNIASILGVDIDDSLISKANTNLRVAYSLNNPNTNDNAIDLSLRFHYFPQSMTNMFGMMPMSLPPTQQHGKGFPFNVHFEAMDWTKQKVDKYNQYDTILA